MSRSMVGRFPEQGEWAEQIFTDGPKSLTVFVNGAVTGDKASGRLRLSFPPVQSQSDSPSEPGVSSRKDQV